MAGNPDWSRMDTKERLMRQSVESPTGCRLWIGATIKDGYGLTRYNGKKTTAHRVSYMAYRGPIKPGLFVCHKCDVPSCINPDHLFLGTQQDNMVDMHQKGRNNTMRGENNGQSKVAADDVRAIREDHDHLTHAEVGALYHLSPSQVAAIRNGKSWVIEPATKKDWSNRGERSSSAKLTTEQAKQIKYGHAGKTDREVAEMFGVCRQQVTKIRKGLRWSHI